MNRIYLDNAASSFMDEECLAAMKPYFCELQGNPSSIHGHGRILRTAIEKARKTIAACLNAHPSEIYFTSGGTEADNAILTGAVHKYGIRHIISTPIEHHAVTHTLTFLEHVGGVKISYLTLDEKGNIHMDELAHLLATHPHSMVSLMHANNEIGTMIDLDAVAQLCITHQALFHSDTVQTVGQYAFDLQQTPIHYMTGAAHKFYGPKGVGFMFVRQGHALPSFMHGGSQERNLRAGTENVAGIVGMAFALQKCTEELIPKAEKLWELKSYMMAALQAHIPFIHFNGETARGKSIPTVLNVSFDCGDEDKMLLFNLDIQGISVSGGSACTSGSDIGSHVLAGIQTPRKYAMNAIRFSFGKHNTKEELDFVVETLQSLLLVRA